MARDEGHTATKEPQVFAHQGLWNLQEVGQELTENRTPVRRWRARARRAQAEAQAGSRREPLLQDLPRGLRRVRPSAAEEAIPAGRQEQPASDLLLPGQ